MSFRLRQPLVYGAPTPTNVYYYWTGSGVVARQNNTSYSVGNRMVIDPADVSTNYLTTRKVVWECITAGISNAAAPPTWVPDPTPDSTMITDGSVVWIARRPGYSVGNTVDWSFATIYIDYVIRAATTGSIILVHYTSQEFLGGTDVTYVFPDDSSVISVNKDNNNTPTPMGTTGYIGSLTGTSPAITLQGNRIYIDGITFRTTGTGVDEYNIATADGNHFEFNNVNIWMETTSTNTSVRIFIGPDNLSTAAYCKFTNCTFRFGATTQGFLIRHTRVEFQGCSISSLGAIPSVLFLGSTRSNPNIIMVGCDLSHVSGGATALVGNSLTAQTYHFIQCKLGSTINPLVTQTGKETAAVYLHDCSSGNTHTFFAYYDAFGNVVSDTGLKYTTGAADQSWRITTNSTCSYYTPFVSPFIDWYNTNTSTPVTPYIEILSNSGTTAYKDTEVWGEFFAKTTSLSTQSTLYSDRATPLATGVDQATGATVSAWTGYTVGNAWSGKVDSGSPITPAVVGAIRGRVVVGVPNTVIYVDPQIRT